MHFNYSKQYINGLLGLNGTSHVYSYKDFTRANGWDWSFIIEILCLYNPCLYLNIVSKYIAHKHYILIFKATHELKWVHLSKYSYKLLITVRTVWFISIYIKTFSANSIVPLYITYLRVSITLHFLIIYKWIIIQTVDLSGILILMRKIICDVIFFTLQFNILWLLVELV